MNDLRNRLARDLKTAVSRLHHLAEVAASEDSPWTTRSNAAFADEVDGIQANDGREVGLAARELLLGRVNRLSAALDRMSAGAYGTCAECGDAISPRRLHAMPEVATCLRCQDGLERAGRPVDRSRGSVFAAGEGGATGAASPEMAPASYLPTEDPDVRVPGVLRAALSF